MCEVCVGMGVDLEYNNAAYIYPVFCSNNTSTYIQVRDIVDNSYG